MRRVAALAGLLLTAACGSSQLPQAPPAHRPYKDLPELTTTTTSTTTTTVAPRPRAARSKPRARVSGVARRCSLDDIKRMESGGDYGAVSRSGKHRGAYQFDAATWRSVGGTGDPAAASPEEQDARAAELMRRRGTQPWSVCR